MYNLGFISLNHESEASYFTEVAKRAALRGIVCYRFIPTSINPLTQLVKGKKFELESQSWINSEFPIPTILYDRCFYGDDQHSKKAIPIVNWLKNREDITFLGYGLPNKMELYKTLVNTELAPYLPPSQQVNSYKTVFNRIENWKKIMLKPITGSQGFGIYYIEKTDDSLLVKTEKTERSLNVLLWINRKCNFGWSSYLEITTTLFSLILSYVMKQIFLLISVFFYKRIQKESGLSEERVSVRDKTKESCRT
jgi:hypothetical protein